MNLDIEEYLEGQELSDLKIIVDDILKIIECSSLGKDRQFKVLENNFSEDSSVDAYVMGHQQQIYWTISKLKVESGDNGDDQSAFLKLIVEIGDSSDVIVKECFCMKQMLRKIHNVASLVDYIFWSFCPSLCAIRSMMYTVETCKKAVTTTPNPADYDDTDNKVAEFSIQKELHDGDYEEDEENCKIYFCIKNTSDGDSFIELKLSHDLSHMICFQNGNRENGILLPPILASKTLEADIKANLSQGICYLENASFALEDNSQNEHVVNSEVDTNNLLIISDPRVSEVANLLFKLLSPKQNHPLPSSKAKQLQNS